MKTGFIILFTSTKSIHNYTRGHFSHFFIKSHYYYLFGWTFLKSKECKEAKFSDHSWTRFKRVILYFPVHQLSDKSRLLVSQKIRKRMKDINFSDAPRPRDSWSRGGAHRCAVRWRLSKSYVLHNVQFFYFKRNKDTSQAGWKQICAGTLIFQKTLTHDIWCQEIPQSREESNVELSIILSNLVCL